GEVLYLPVFRISFIDIVSETQVFGGLNFRTWYRPGIPCSSSAPEGFESFVWLARRDEIGSGGQIYA
ncbi:MAG TPA: hypothetical protein PK671_26545, partial [Candidatus Obscuribacter sp.]|nr:hypothetical protein [Candidatus Obscuribacter sp.]